MLTIARIGLFESRIDAAAVLRSRLLCPPRGAEPAGAMARGILRSPIRNDHLIFRRLVQLFGRTRQGGASGRRIGDSRDFGRRSVAPHLKTRSSRAPRFPGQPVLYADTLSICKSFVHA